MVTRIFLLMAVFFTHVVCAQQNGCSVTVAAISETYSGGCKHGLAQGKGIATGIDHYEGQFNKGMPDGTGTYTWADGSYYEGSWKAGLRAGKGKMVIKDSTVTGYWMNDVFIGEKVVKPYMINYSLSVPRYKIEKIHGPDNNVIIKLFKGGSYNTEIAGFNLAYDSGIEYKNGPYYGIMDVRFPLHVKLNYLTLNYLQTSTYNVIFEFTITEPGSWEVSISH